MRLRAHTEGGFTLVELLVAIVILGIITVPLSGTVMSALRNTGSTQERMDLSHDAQLSSSYFARDVAGVGIRDYENTGGNSLPFKKSVLRNVSYSCGGAASPISVLVLLSDAWDPDESQTTPEEVVVAYYLQATELHRLKCSGSDAPIDLVIAHNVKSATATCSSTCESTTVPNEITLHLVVTKPLVGDYPITLNGQRRQS